MTNPPFNIRWSIPLFDMSWQPVYDVSPILGIQFNSCVPPPLLQTNSFIQIGHQTRLDFIGMKIFQICALKSKQIPALQNWGQSLTACNIAPTSTSLMQIQKPRIKMGLFFVDLGDIIRQLNQLGYLTGILIIKLIKLIG